ncbi:hypothetical protein C5B96_00995 [Subtercola sp. Z020]|nr:hypothetical protein C5B96_00995 [Subtercola sp. Z020]
MDAPMDDRTALTLTLTDLVRRVPGVTDVYSSVPVLVATVSKLSQLVTRRDLGPDLVTLSEVDGELVVAVTIGVGEGLSATEVCREVYDAIAEHLAAGTAPQPASIAVTVGRIG